MPLRPCHSVPWGEDFRTDSTTTSWTGLCGTPCSSCTAWGAEIYRLNPDASCFLKDNRNQWDNSLFFWLWNIRRYQANMLSSISFRYPQVSTCDGTVQTSWGSECTKRCGFNTGWWMKMMVVKQSVQYAWVSGCRNHPQIWMQTMESQSSCIKTFKHFKLAFLPSSSLHMFWLQNYMPSYAGSSGHSFNEVAHSGRVALKNNTFGWGLKQPEMRLLVWAVETWWAVSSWPVNVSIVQPTTDFPNM